MMKIERKRQEEELIRKKKEDEIRELRELEELQLREYDEEEKNAEHNENEHQEIVCPECNSTLVEMDMLDNHECRCKHCLNPFASYLLSQHYPVCPNNIRSNSLLGKKLNKEQIERLPSLKYKEGEKKGDENKCMVCMEDFKNEDNLRFLPCLHEFHKNCIDQWLEMKAICPVCKAPLDL